MREIGRVILEALIVMAAGTGIALIANLRSDVGLKLGRDYLKRWRAGPRRRPAIRRSQPGRPRCPPTHKTRPQERAATDTRREDRETHSGGRPCSGSV